MHDFAHPHCWSLSHATRPRRRAVVLAFAAGAVALLLATKPAGACSCLAPTVESSYNASSDVVSARVLLSFPAGGERWSLARVREPYKGCSQPDGLVVLSTASSSAACGVVLERGPLYLINGRADGTVFGLPRLRIGLCDYNLPFTELSDHDREFLAGREVCCGDSCACADGSRPVQCFAQPCSVAPACAEAATCVDNYCGGCNAEFYDAVGNAACQQPNRCLSDADCPAGEWCRPTAPDQQALDDPEAPAPLAGGRDLQCVPFVGAGESCEGFRPAWTFERCAPPLVCDTPDFIPDAPGICREPCQSDADCAPTGCSGQICAAESVVTTCEFRAEYACYQDAAITSCGCRAGRCAWEATSELQQCLADAGF